MIWHGGHLCMDFSLCYDLSTALFSFTWHVHLHYGFQCIMRIQRDASTSSRDAPKCGVATVALASSTGSLLAPCKVRTGISIKWSYRGMVYIGHLTH